MPRKYAAVQRTNCVSALVGPVPPTVESSNTASGVPEVSSFPPEKFPPQMNGHGVPLVGKLPLCPLIELPDESFTHGAGDQCEPKSLKSPNCPRLLSPNCASGPPTDAMPDAKLK